MKTERGLDRLVAFSDAVVAIAITLIILPLVDTARDLSGQTARLPEFVWSQWVTVWIDHHSLFEQIDGYSRQMTWLSFAWLAGIVFLPLPTVLLVAGHSSDHGSTVLYISTMLVVDLAIAGIETLAQRQGLLKDDHDRGLGRRHWTPAALMAIALLVAAFVPGVGDYALLVLLLSIPSARVSRMRQEHRKRAETNKTPGVS